MDRVYLILDDCFTPFNKKIQIDRANLIFDECLTSINNKLLEKLGERHKWLINKIVFSPIINEGFRKDSGKESNLLI